MFTNTACQETRRRGEGALALNGRREGGQRERGQLGAGRWGPEVACDGLREVQVDCAQPGNRRIGLASQTPAKPEDAARSGMCVQRGMFSATSVTYRSCATSDLATMVGSAR